MDSFLHCISSTQGPSYTNNRLQISATDFVMMPIPIPTYTATIYLLITSNYSEPAHYAIFVPTTDNPNYGRLIHIMGSTEEGFYRQFRHNYNFDRDRGYSRKILLGQVDEMYVHSERSRPQEQPFVDSTNIPCDELEEIALTVPVPGPNPNWRTDPSVRESS